ncbi:MAG TPA: hypothetical protein VF648_00405 [Pyrinomonadaceae bacterium]|jgi:hypothetical protein
MTNDEALKLRKNDTVDVSGLVATVDSVYRGINDDVMIATVYGDLNASVCEIKLFGARTKNFKVYGKIEVTREFKRFDLPPLKTFLDFAFEMPAETESEIELKLKDPMFAKALKLDFPNAADVRIVEITFFEKNDVETSPA